MEYVEYKGKKYKVIGFKLTLRNLAIDNTSEIINLENLSTILFLDLTGNKIENIEGLEKLTQLKKLSLRYNDITSINGLDTLVNLETLDLSKNKIGNISGLENLKKLKKLDLQSNCIKKITGLENQSKLENLNLEDNKISEISGFDALSNLKDLYLNKNKITKIENLNKLNNLEYLFLGSNPISTITGLENLEKLRGLYLNETIIPPDLFRKLGGVKGDINGTYAIKEPQNLVKFCQGNYVEYNGVFYYVNNNSLELNDLDIQDIKDIKNLEELTSLKTLQLQGNKIEAIDGIDHLINLETIYLDNNLIDEVGSLNSLKNLRNLSLSNNKIKKILGIAELSSLNTLNLSNNEIYEIENLENNIKLRKLDLSNNKISEIKNIHTLNSLVRLHLAGNQITEIKGLENLLNLRSLYLEDNSISKIENLETNINLEILNLDSNAIERIENLSTFSNLKTLHLSNNNISKIENLDILNNLRLISLDGNMIPKDLEIVLSEPLTETLTQLVPHLCVSYCILDNIFEQLDKPKDIYLDYIQLIEKYPILKRISYNELVRLLSQFGDYEILEEDNGILAITTPKLLCLELERFCNNFNDGDFLSFQDISKELKLHDKNSAYSLITYLKKNIRGVNFFNLEEKGIKVVKIGNHQLIVFDTLNQNYFLEKSNFSNRLKEIIDYISIFKKSGAQVIKLVFYTERILKNNPQALKYLDKIGWIPVRSFKGNRPDYDSKLETIALEISRLSNRIWDHIFIISFDSDIINFFMKEFIDIPIKFITDPTNNSLDKFPYLKKEVIPQFNLKIYSK